MEEDLLVDKKNDPSFDDLCGEASFVDGDCASSEVENQNWGLLNGRILARVFHFIRSDMKSLISSAATCKRWNLAAKLYRNLCTQVDLSSAGPGCTDSMFWNIMVGYLFSFFFSLCFLILYFILIIMFINIVLQEGYEKERLTSLNLTGCSNISACVLEEVLRLFPCISLINIRGCSQLKELISKFQNVKWIKSPSYNKNTEESYSKLKSLKLINNSESSLVDRKDSSNHPFRQGVYKRAKPFDARKSSAVMSRDAQMRRWMHRKSENGYRKMEGFIAINLKDIMKENIFEFFIPKVTTLFLSFLFVNIIFYFLTVKLYAYVICLHHIEFSLHRLPKLRIG